MDVKEGARTTTLEGGGGGGWCFTSQMSNTAPREAFNGSIQAANAVACRSIMVLKSQVVVKTPYPSSKISASFSMAGTHARAAIARETNT